MNALFRCLLLAVPGLVGSEFGIADSAGTIPAATLQGLPPGATPAAIALDLAGNILIAGAVQSQGEEASPFLSSPDQAFVAKFAQDGQTLLYLNVLGQGRATAIAADAAGNAYVAGYTRSPDFPTTAGAWNISIYGVGAFVQKLDPSGNIIYGSLFGGAAPGSPPCCVNTLSYASGIAVNAAGEAFVTGTTIGGGFPVIGSTIRATFPQNDYFLVRLSAAGDKPIYSVTGPGGTAIVVDDQNNAYVAGLAFPGQVPITTNADAFQTSLLGLHQYACKIDASASVLYFCTYVSGMYGETQTSIAIDASHNVYLAGTTQSVDYPVTQDALQARNPSQVPRLLMPTGFSLLPQTGTFSKLSPDGSQLLYSTYLGGSQADSPSGIAIDPSGNAYIAAQVQSPDYPGLPVAPQRCLPDRLHPMPVMTVLNGGVAYSALVESAATAALMAVDPTGGAWLASGGNQVTHIALAGNGPPDAIACVTDALDFTQADPIVPGQLLTIFGNHLGAGPSVTINGTPASLLYASENQINLQVPTEVAGQSLAVLNLSASDGTTAQRVLPIAMMNPSLATNGVTAYPLCDDQAFYSATVYALVVNQDGTINSCSNPAPVGSQVQVVLNGAGPQAPTVVDRNNNIVSAITAAPGLPGVWLVTLQAVQATSAAWAPSVLFTWVNLQFVQDTPLGGGGVSRIYGVAAREQNVVVWLER